MVWVLHRCQGLSAASGVGRGGIVGRGIGVGGGVRFGVGVGGARKVQTDCLRTHDRLIVLPANRIGLQETVCSAPRIRARRTATPHRQSRHGDRGKRTSQPQPPLRSSTAQQNSPAGPARCSSRPGLNPSVISAALVIPAGKPAKLTRVGLSEEGCNIDRDRQLSAHGILVA